MPESESENVPEPIPLPINTTITGQSDDSNTAKYIPIFVLTGVFGAIFAFGPLLVRKGPNKQIIRVCIMMTAFCIYLFWVTAYIAQMHPLTGPRLHNTTMAWYQYKFGTTVARPKKYSESNTDEENNADIMFELDSIDGFDEVEAYPPPDGKSKRTLETKPKRDRLIESG